MKSTRPGGRSRVLARRTFPQTPTRPRRGLWHLSPYARPLPWAHDERIRALDRLNVWPSTCLLASCGAPRNSGFKNLPQLGQCTSGAVFVLKCQMVPFAPAYKRCKQPRRIRLAVARRMLGGSKELEPVRFGVSHQACTPRLCVQHQQPTGCIQVDEQDSRQLGLRVRSLANTRQCRRSRVLVLRSSRGRVPCSYWGWCSGCERRSPGWRFALRLACGGPSREQWLKLRGQWDDWTLPAT